MGVTEVEAERAVRHGCPIKSGMTGEVPGVTKKVPGTAHKNVTLGLDPRVQVLKVWFISGECQ